MGVENLDKYFKNSETFAPQLRHLYKKPFRVGKSWHWSSKQQERELYFDEGRTDIKTMKHAKRMGELICGMVKGVFCALQKSPELQLVTVLMMGVMASSLIIYGFTINDAGVPSLPVTSSVAQNFVRDLVEFSGQMP